MKHIVMRWLLVCVLSCLLLSCAGLRGGGDAPAERTDATVRETGDSEREASLKRAVRDYIEKVGTRDDSGQAAVVRYKPYFCKVYECYPEGPDAFDFSLRETESRTTPIVANVTARKIRYATRLHHKREDARQDDTLIRESGMETMTFELRHNQWVRVGGLFVSERKERSVEGRWIPVEEEAEQASGAEGADEKGRLGRFWSRLFGG